MSSQPYQPSPKIINNYARVLIHYALNSGAGVKPGEVVQCMVPEAAKSLALELQNEILRAGGHPMIHILPSGFEKSFFELASEAQLKFFPEAYLRAKADMLTHNVAIIADVDPLELADVDPAKIMTMRNSRRPYRDWLVTKEHLGKYTWTAALWGVQAKADIVGLTLEEYWDQIVKACFLDAEDPIQEWKKFTEVQTTLKHKLNELEIESLHMVGADMDLTIKLGADRQWQGGSGRNIPSFELFTSPDWRGTNGWIQFNQPVYRYGGVIDGARMEFADGLVVKASAKTGDDLLQEMLKTANANKVGEFSLTDSDMSRITHTMAETLFDENIGGPFGNSHIAIGMAYRDCFKGDPSQIGDEEWDVRGYNNSAEHTDFVTTTDRTVTATLTNGTQMVIYQDGHFKL